MIICKHEKKPSVIHEKAMNTSLVLYAEHEFNASTFTAYSWDWLPFDLLGNMVCGSLAGGVIAWILGKVK